MSATTHAATLLRIRGQRYYADLRRYAKQGGRYEALVPSGERYATMDRDVAVNLLAARVSELEERRRRNHLLGRTQSITLGEYSARYLVLKARSAKVTFDTIRAHEQRLRRWVEFIGTDVELDEITTDDVRRFDAYLATLPGMGGKTLSGQTRRHYLNTLSNLYRYAGAEGYVHPGDNPVVGMIDKPVGNRVEARWLEVTDAALFLEAARSFQPKRVDLAIPFVHPIVATLLLTGGRWSEVVGLTVADISFDRGTVRFRPNEHRHLKTKTSNRTVPLHPQLRQILSDYRSEYGRASGLLFPSPRMERAGLDDGMITDIRKQLDGIAETIGWAPGDVRTKLFRHTYCAARLQTLDGGHPISTYTVAREMGHGGDSLVKRVYGHLGKIRHRSEHVEFRVEPYADHPDVREGLTLLCDFRAPPYPTAARPRSESVTLA